MFRAWPDAGRGMSFIRAPSLDLFSSTQPTSCTNKQLDGHETDVDCGVCRAGWTAMGGRALLILVACAVAWRGSCSPWRLLFLAASASTPALHLTPAALPLIPQAARPAPSARWATAARPRLTASRTTARMASASHRRVLVLALQCLCMPAGLSGQREPVHPCGCAQQALAAASCSSQPPTCTVATAILA